MTRIDERGAAVVLDEGDMNALAALFAGQAEVVAAYLFGSQARGEAGPLSDVDLAVWLDPSLARERRWARQERLMVESGAVLRTGEVQLVVLNDAPPLLVHRVLRDARLLADRDPALRVRLETEALIRYLDTIPLRDQISRELARRMAGDSYGRPPRA